MKKKNFHISIDKPCNEKFEDFEPTKEGGFCSSCKKDVIDFSKMTNDQIIAKLRGSSNACGRFQESQLGDLGSVYDTQSNFTFSYIAAGLSLVSMLGFNVMNAQNQKLEKQFISDSTAQINEQEVLHLKGDVALNVKSEIQLIGRVIDANKIGVPFATVFIDSSIGAATDIEGRFKLVFNRNVNDRVKLQVSSVGYNSVIISDIKTDTLDGIINLNDIILEEQVVMIAGGIGMTTGGISFEKKWTPRWVWRKTTNPFRRFYYKIF